MRTFADWVEYYNKLDVEPFLEALKSMRDFDTGLQCAISKMRCHCRGSQ